MSAKRKKQATRRAPRGSKKTKARAGHVLFDAQGRAHLVVVRDASGKAKGLALSEPLFHDDWQNHVAAAAANTTHRLLSAGPTRENTAKVGANLMGATSAIIHGLLEHAPEPPACRRGCAHCCHQAVGVAAPEVFAIYDHLKKSHTKTAFDVTVRRVREADDRTRGSSSEKRYLPENPCPFLEKERCSIYAVRPLACRGKNSLDADACEKSLYDPVSRAEYFAGTLSMPSYLEPLRVFHAVATGLDLALHELFGLEVAPLELTAAMRVMMDDPKTVAQAWLRGKDPFAAGRGADAANKPGISELTGRRTP